MTSLGFEGFAESDQEKSQEGCSRPREQHVQGPEAGKSTVGLRLRKETCVSRVSECGEYGSHEDGPQLRGWRSQDLEAPGRSSVVINFWEAF